MQHIPSTSDLDEQIDESQLDALEAEGGSWDATEASMADLTLKDVPDAGVTKDQIEQVRAQVSPAFRAEVDDAMATRFIRATGGNLDLSVKRLNATLQWRREMKPEELVCRACAKDPRAHYCHLVGHCNQGRPVIYTCMELPNNRVYEDNRDHMIQTFETAIKVMPPGVEQWVWVCDFHGFSKKDVNPKMAKAFLNVSAEYYPERLGLFIIVDAPKLFSVLWKAVRKFVDPKTRRKIRFLPYDPEKGDRSELKGELDQHFDPVTAGWMLREMEENRDKAKVAQKVYSIPSLYERAKTGELCFAGHKYCFHGHLTKPADPGAAPGAATPQPSAGLPLRHSALGTPALLHTFSKQPHLLLPQANASG